ncbi:MAG: hypothetical protein IPN29_17480 [Saprospiraceae bacterium]|nr:hypothetical protein [Saprospiraceae bacterium]
MNKIFSIRIIFIANLYMIIQTKIASQIITYGGNNSECSMSMIPANDDGYILTGFSKSFDIDFIGLNKGEDDIFIMKTDKTGKKIWIATFGGSDDENSLKVIPTIDGYLITGFTSSKNFDFYGLDKGKKDIFIIKINNEGKKQWIKTYGGSNDDIGTSIVKANDNGFIITGYTKSIDFDFEGLNNGSEDIFVLKINEKGEKQWIKTFGSYGIDFASAIICDETNGYILTGGYNHNSGDLYGQFKGNYDIPLMKISNNGELKYFKSFGGTGNEVCNSIIKDQNGDFLLVGVTDSNDGEFYKQNKGSKDIFAIKVNNFFEKIWSKTYGGSGLDVGISIITNTTGQYIITGSSTSNDEDLIGMNRGDEDAYILVTDKDGTKEWIRTFGGKENECCTSILNFDAKEYIISGRSSSNLTTFDKIEKKSSNIYIQKIKL